MENIPLLRDIVVLMVVSIPIIILLTRIGLPTVIGFLLAGVIIGPFGLGLVHEAHEVETISQIGIVLLLFTIGLEFSVTKMLNIRREAVLGGGLQVLFTLLITLGAGLFFEFSFVVALLLGFVVTLSSTAIVLKLLVDKGQVNTAHGNMTVGILLFQDICVVLMVMVLQSIGGESDSTTLQVVTGLLLSLLSFAVIVVVVAFVIPRIFEQVVKLRNREIFILTILLACLGTAWLTSMFGLSLALGAFIAGLVISESEYSHQIVAEVIPFRDTFASLFFISIGMLLDFKYVILHLPMLFALVAGDHSVKGRCHFCRRHGFEVPVQEYDCRCALFGPDRRVLFYPHKDGRGVRSFRARPLPVASGGLGNNHGAYSVDLYVVLQGRFERRASSGKGRQRRRA